MSDIAKSSLIVTIFTALGIGLSFFSNVVVAAKFGAGKEMDIFLASTTLPLFIISILSGALNFTFIPVFAEYKTKGSQEVWKVVSSFINLNLLVMSILCLVGIVCAYQIMGAIAPGFTEEKLSKATELLQWLFPIIIFSVFNELMAGVYYSNQRFVVPSLNKVVSPVIVVIYVFFFHASLSTTSIIFAMLTATALQTILLILGIFRTPDFHYSFVIDFKHPGVLKILKLMTPLIFGMIIYRAIPIFDRLFLSKLSEGSITHVEYAMKLMIVISTIIVSGISTTIFPLMSKHAASQNWDELRSLISVALRMLFFISIPCAVLVGSYSKSMIKLAFERGAFTSFDTVAVYNAFFIYLLTIPAISIGTIIGQIYYVLQDTKTPAILGVVEMLIYVGLCTVLIPSVGYLAIPVAYLLYFNVSLINILIVRIKLKTLDGKRIAVSMIKNFVSAILALSILKLFTASTSNPIAAFVIVLVGLMLYLAFSAVLFETEEGIIAWKKIMSLKTVWKESK